MATQQVKFHSVSTAEYNDVKRPINEGSLYFIDDNGEIRKGGKHVTGTRVFLAEDTATTCSPVEDLTIYIDGKAITEEGSEQPKRGDILRVKHILSTKTVKIVDEEGNPVYEEDGQTQKTETVEDAVEYSAYVYAANGGAYDVSKWEACDGNVDASKVILTQNITMAGNYDKVGNLTKGGTSGKSSTFLTDSDGNAVGTTGVSVYELIKQMLSKTVEPKINANPSVTLTVTKESYDVEYGSVVTPTYSVSYTDGNYKYDGQSGTQSAGCSRTGWIVTNVDDGTKNSGNVNPITADSASKTLTVKAKATYSAGTNTPKNNLGDDSSITKIAAGTTAEVSKTVTVTAYRKNFWISFDHDHMVDIDTVELDGSDENLNSDKIRAANHGTKAIPTEVDLAGTPFQQVLIFLPATTANKNKLLAANTAKGLPYIKEPGKELVGGKSSPRTIVIKGAGDDEGADYYIWEIKTGTPVDAGDTIGLIWG